MNSKERGFPEALIAICVLATVGLIVVLAEMGIAFVQPAPLLGLSERPSFNGAFAAAAGGVLLLLYLAVRRRRTVQFGLPAMVLALITLALVALLTLGDHVREFVLFDARPNVTAGLILLGIGSMGLLLAAFAPREPAAGRQIPGRLAALGLLVGTLLLFLLSTLWMQSISGLGYTPQTDLLAEALMSCAAPGVVVLPLLLLGRRSGAGKAETRRPRLKLPLGALILFGSLAAVASALDQKVLLEPGPGLPYYVKPEFLSNVFRPVPETTWAGPLLRFFGLLLILVLEMAIRLTRRGRTDARLIVPLHWIVWVAVGGAILHATGGLAHAAGEVVRLGPNTTPWDLKAGISAGILVCSALPYFGVALFLAAAHPFRPGIGWFRWRRAGVGILALATLGLVIMAAAWWWSLEGGARHAAYSRLRLGAELLQWGAIVFLVCGTIGAVVEFVRCARNGTPPG